MPDSASGGCHSMEPATTPTIHRLLRGRQWRLPRFARPPDTGLVSEDAALWLFVALLLPTGCGTAWVLGRRLVRRLGERRHAPVSGPPIERVAADLRRLRAQLEAVEDDPHLPGKALRCRAIRA